MKCSLALTRVCLLPLVAGLLCFTPIMAQEGDHDPEAWEELSRAERKQRAKQARIDEYLRNKEARQARKAAKQSEQDAARVEAEAAKAPATTVQESDDRAQQLREEEAERIEAVQLAEEQVQADAAKAERRKAKQLAAASRANQGKKGKAPRSSLPRDLARAQSNIRATDLGDNETVLEYLELIEQQEASPDQLAAFGSFLAQNGFQSEALEYYNVAVRLDSSNSVLWVNHGTLLLQSGDTSGAANSFNRALTANPNNAVAHYNMGAALNELDRYDEAISAYTAALTLDPELGDPAQNPQAANNDMLLAVRLMLFQKQTGSLSVPMIDLDTGKLVGAVEDDDGNP
jgi:tetratricopeptide (TPR) repeat protein